MPKKAKERHLVSEREPITINGHVIGESFTGTYVDGPPVFGLCHAVDCPNTATNETLIGLHFCDDHYSRFYSDEHFQLDPSREFPEPSALEH